MAFQLLYIFESSWQLFVISIASQLLHAHNIPSCQRFPTLLTSFDRFPISLSRLELGIMDASKGVVFGSSLIVPSVMELTKKNIDVVPPRYIRSDLDESIEPGSSIPTVPVIDIEALLSGSKEELEKLDSASKHWGFFQVVNHGVSTTLVEMVKSETESFFRLSFEAKKKLWQQPGQVEGFGQLFVLSEEQKLDWSDMFYMTTFPTILRQPDLLAKLPQSLRHALESYSLELKNLAITIMEKMAEALKIDAKEMSEMFSDAFQSMRLNYYPTCPQPNQVIGFTPHSDSDALTILLQLNETEGLQIRKDGQWIPVKPLANAFVVNIGDIMEILSNGVYRSIEHRVMVNSSKERLSVATFLTPNMDANVGPAQSLISPDNPALFQTVPLQEYLKGHFAKKLDGKAYLDDNRQ